MSYATSCWKREGWERGRASASARYCITRTSQQGVSLVCEDAVAKSRASPCPLSFYNGDGCSVVKLHVHG